VSEPRVLVWGINDASPASAARWWHPLKRRAARRAWLRATSEIVARLRAPITEGGPMTSHHHHLEQMTGLEISAAARAQWPGLAERVQVFNDLLVEAAELLADPLASDARRRQVEDALDRARATLAIAVESAESYHRLEAASDGRSGAYGMPIPAGTCGAYFADEGGEWMCRRAPDHGGEHSPWGGDGDAAPALVRTPAELADAVRVEAGPDGPVTYHLEVTADEVQAITSWEWRMGRRIEPWEPAMAAALATRFFVVPDVAVHLMAGDVGPSDLTPGRPVASTYRSPEDQVATFGPDNQQIPELQGTATPELAGRIRARSTDATRWYGWNPDGSPA
jgi:hypothetical protein